jgi:hypothetical protein
MQSAKGKQDNRRVFRMAEKQINKIVVPLHEEWHGFSSETLWGEKVDADIYRIDSIPFFANGISLDDIVKVKTDKDKRLLYQKTISKGKNCTYRVFFNEDINPQERSKYLNLLHDYGDIEYYEEKDLYALSVLKQKVHELYKILVQFEKDKILDFEEGDCLLD